VLSTLHQHRQHAPQLSGHRSTWENTFRLPRPSHHVAADSIHAIGVDVDLDDVDRTVPGVAGRTTTNEFVDALADPSTADQLLYFYGHATVAS
jgi:hypothetical protein